MTKKKGGPSLRPQGPRGFDPPYWYYEYRGGIQLYARSGEKNSALAIVKIPWSQLLRSAARCGKIASNEGRARRSAVAKRGGPTSDSGEAEE